MEDDMEFPEMRIFRPPPRPEGMSDEEFFKLESAQSMKFLQSGDPFGALLERSRSLEEMQDAFYLAGPKSLLAMVPETGDVALHVAARDGREDVILWLLEVGAKWHIENKEGKTAEHVARDAGHMNCARILWETAVQQEYEHINGPRDNQGGYHPLDGYVKNNEKFLSRPCRYVAFRDHPQEHAMRSAQGTFVMGGWEQPIMDEVDRILIPQEKRELRVLNVGFGLGMIDRLFQSHDPRNHTIIEAHPDALRAIKGSKFHQRPGVRIMYGTWREILRNEETRLSLGKFDAIYFDTFEEDCRDHMEFWSYVPSLMRGPDSRFSFFHGVGQGYDYGKDIFTEMIVMLLRDIGLSTTWTEVEIDAERKQKYSVAPITEGHMEKIPLCMLAPTIPKKFVRRPPARFDRPIFKDLIEEWQEIDGWNTQVMRAVTLPV